MEGRGGNLEKNTNQHERQTSKNEGLVLRYGSECGDLVDLRGSGSAKDECNAVKQEGSSERAEEEIFDGGFRAPAGVLAPAGKNVCGDGGNFECNKDDEQLNGGGEQAHADRAKDDERVELALMVGVLRERVEREQQCHEHDAADKDVEEDCEGAGFDRGVKAGSFGQGKLPQAGPKGDRGSQCCDPTQRTARPCRRERGINEHDDDARQREDDLGEDAVDVVNWGHR